MRNDYSVGILNHRMDDALGMNDNLNAFRLEIKSQRASITSRPLFISVAESTVIFLPIDQFG